jgi:hypothetical protein
MGFDRRSGSPLFYGVFREKISEWVCCDQEAAEMNRLKAAQAAVFSRRVQNKKPRWRRDFYYLDGLVSTGKQIPYTILKIIFPIRKNFPINFMHNFFSGVEKGFAVGLRKIFSHEVSRSGIIILVI